MKNVSMAMGVHARKALNQEQATRAAAAASPRSPSRAGKWKDGCDLAAPCCVAGRSETKGWAIVLTREMPILDDSKSGFDELEGQVYPRSEYLTECPHFPRLNGYRSW